MPRLEAGKRTHRRLLCWIILTGVITGLGGLPSFLQAKFTGSQNLNQLQPSRPWLRPQEITPSAVAPAKPLFVEYQKTTPAAGPAGATKQNWKLSLELAFGEKSPYSKKYPSLYNLPYSVNQAITKNVLDRIIAVALRETGAHRVQVLYAPGGYLQFPVTPSAQLDIQTSPAATLNMLDIIGFLAQQTEVIGSRHDPTGNNPALQIVERRGQRLAHPLILKQFWNRLRRRAPKLQGFLPVRINQQPGLRIIDTTASWTLRDVVGFDDAVENISRELRIPTNTRYFMVHSVNAANDWAINPSGQRYLKRLESRGQARLARRLLKQYQPQVERWIQLAFKKYAPIRLKRQLKLSQPLS